MLSTISPTQCPAWHKLQLQSQTPQPHLRDWLQDPQRGARMRLDAAGLQLDYSRQRVDDAILSNLLSLAQERQVMAQAQAMVRGERINLTEQRQVLHVALRGSMQVQPPWGPALSSTIQAELDRFCSFAESARAGAWCPADAGDPITDVVNLGIGGSDLGPRMASQALALLPSRSSRLRVHYVSSPDPAALYQILLPLKPRRTAFIIQSKSFTTQETLLLAASARRWLEAAGLSAPQAAEHFAAVTAAPALARELGVPDTQIFRIWDWVGGRYSVWSAIGLPVAMTIGAAAFREFLAGAEQMDQHFLAAPAARNMPLLMALLGLWNRNFLGAPTHLIASYSSLLERFPAFIQQMDMESNGKSTDSEGQTVSVATGPIVWGGSGLDGQHAYFQLLHQGQHLVPVDFIGVGTDTTPWPTAADQHQLVLRNLHAQANALAWGRTPDQTRQMLASAGQSEREIQQMVLHRSFAGNVPSSIVWLERVSPAQLGALIALYEHKVFCQAALWNILPYDQWGVELGKTLAKALERSPPSF